MILGVSMAGSIDLGVIAVVDPEMGVNGVFETTCKAWVVTMGISSAFCLLVALVGVSMIYSHLKPCVPTGGAN
ncbi:UNVERIFIED_CONTAM: hypothetical protein Sangu_2880600 [Sesamum angustifolium]|uniref:G-protein coupled receptors family 3 profile domain-containing protein n=1 Tax=Sesamum angustifolium TaxID=2727405 RepID=A0AAW2IPM4_9LAMI